MGRSESFRLIQAAGGIVTRDGRICVVRRTRYGPEWSLPNEFLSRHLQGLGRIDEAVAWSIRLRELSERRPVCFKNG